MNDSLIFYRNLINTGLPKSVAANMTKSIFPSFNKPRSPCKSKINIALKPKRTISKKKSSCGCEQSSQVKFYLSTYLQTHSNFAKNWLHSHLHLLSPSQLQRFQKSLRHSFQINSLTNKLRKM